MRTAIVVEHQTLAELLRIPGFVGIVMAAGEPLLLADTAAPAAIRPAVTGRRYKQGASHPGFEVFWQAYPKRCPRRVRSTAIAAWDKERPDLPTVLAALAWQDELDDWLREGGQFIPAPSVWLNQRRWELEQPTEMAF